MNETSTPSAKNGNGNGSSSGGSSSSSSSGGIERLAGTGPSKGHAIEVTDLGKTTVSDDVVTTIAYLAAEQVPGVYRLGTTGLRGAIDRISRSSGVSSDVGMRQVAITLNIVVEFGYRLSEVTKELRERVIEAVEHMADRQVVSVDIAVVDIHVAKQEQPHARVLD